MLIDQEVADLIEKVNIALSCFKPWLYILYCCLSNFI